LWLFKNSHNTQFRVVTASLMPQGVVVFLKIATTRNSALWLFLSCHNALWLFENSHNTQFRVVAVSLMPQRVVVFFSAQ